MTTKTDVEAYYHEFARRVQLNDFLLLNRRQEAVRRLCARHIPEGARVLEVGCGVGIISRHLGRRASRVLSVDINATAVEIARAHAGTPHHHFQVLDVTTDAAPLEAEAPFDAIVLPDVIEHIPVQEHPGLFARLEKLLAPAGVLLLTYPSPEYQAYLREHQPEALQVVDETVELRDLLASTSLEPRYYRNCDVWNRRQYVHLVLGRPQPFSPEPVPQSAPQRFAFRLRNKLWRLRNKRLVERFRHGG